MPVPDKDIHSVVLRLQMLSVDSLDPPLVEILLNGSYCRVTVGDQATTAGLWRYLMTGIHKGLSQTMRLPELQNALKVLFLARNGPFQVLFFEVQLWLRRNFEGS